MPPTFTAHNILPGDGTLTLPETRYREDEHTRFVGVKRMPDVTFRVARAGLRVAGLGCLDGGYATKFDCKGFDSVGGASRR